MMTREKVKRHNLKLRVDFADDVCMGRKNFEVRKNDRGFLKGDTVKFSCVDKSGLPIPHVINDKVYEITYVLSGWGIKDGYVVFGIREILGSDINVGSKWIPCSERLPEEYGEYLCCSRCGQYIIGFPMEVSEGSFFVETKKDFFNCVAWQPLPEPYKGGIDVNIDEVALRSALKKVIDQKENYGFMDDFDVDENYVVIIALEKQIPKKPKQYGVTDKEGVFHPINGINGVPYDLCPNCETNLCTDGFFGRDKKGLNYCEKCGQALDWSE